jgi:regulator of protease activity HflC (stomatin/prohibitin superfamily)
MTSGAFVTEGRSQIVADIKVEIQQVMDSYDSGIIISNVNLVYIKLLPPLTSTITVSVPLITDSMVSR